MKRTINIISIITLFSALIYPAALMAAKEPLAWKLVCNKSNKDCKAYAQIITDNNIVASSFTLQKITLSKNEPPRTVAVLMLPLGFHVPSGIKINVESKISFNAKLLECKSKGCRAVFEANDKIIDHFIKSKMITIKLVDSKTRKGLALTYSLAGFKKIYSSL